MYWNSIAHSGSKFTAYPLPINWNAANYHRWAKRALEEANAGRFSAEPWAPDAVLHSPLIGEVYGRDAIVAALRRQRDSFEEFRQEPHAVLADDEHVVALVNLTVRQKGQEVRAHQVIVAHTNDLGQIKEFWSMFDADALKAGR